MIIEQLNLVELNKLIKLTQLDRCAFWITKDNDLNNVESDIDIVVPIGKYYLEVIVYPKYFRNVQFVKIKSGDDYNSANWTTAAGNSITLKDCFPELDDRDQNQIYQLKSVYNVLNFIEFYSNFEFYFTSWSHGSSAVWTDGWYPMISLEGGFHGGPDYEHFKFSDLPILNELYRRFQNYGVYAWLAIRRGYDCKQKHQTPEYFAAKQFLLS